MTGLRNIAIAALLGSAVSVSVNGCTSEKPSEIPHAAVMAAEGNGEISYRAPSDGMVYVYDVDSDRLLYSGKVEQGQLINVDPNKDKIRIDSRTAYEGAMVKRDHLRIYFDREGSRRVIVEERRIERRVD